MFRRICPRRGQSSSRMFDLLSASYVSNLVLRLVLTDFRSVFKLSKKFLSSFFFFFFFFFCFFFFFFFFFFSDSLYGCCFRYTIVIEWRWRDVYMVLSFFLFMKYSWNVRIFLYQEEYLWYFIKNIAIHLCFKICVNVDVFL